MERLPLSEEGGMMQAIIRGYLTDKGFVPERVEEVKGYHVRFWGGIVSEFMLILPSDSYLVLRIPDYSFLHVEINDEEKKIEFEFIA